MLNQYLDWYNMVEEVLKSDVVNAKEYRDVKRVVVVGMGGSGIVGDFLSVIAQNYSNIPLITFKDFYVPKGFVDSNTFVLSISYSGNTLETVAATLQLLKRGIPVGVVASGGELVDIARRFGLPYVVVRSGLAPRSAMPLMLVASIKLLNSCGMEVVPQDTLRSSISILRDTDHAKKIGDELADFLENSKMPLIVATSKYSSLAIRFKNELNENAKMPVKIEIIPELFHNDIVGWERFHADDKAIVIDSDVEYEKMLLNFYADYLKDIGFTIYYLKLSGNIIERLLFGSLVAGIASVRIAEKLGFDPLQTRSIVKYKEFLKKYREDILKNVLE